MSQNETIIKAMSEGERLTVKSALEKYGIYALSQRCNEMIRDKGIPIQSEFITLDNGKKVKQYWL